MKNRFLRLAKDTSGATAIEYGMIAGLIAVGIITVLVVLGPQITAAFQGISDGLPAVPAPTTP
jgi:pilus assembly protein Flp/PilA